MTYGRRKVENHEKSMGSYDLFAWSDAISIAYLVENLFGAVKAKEIYEAFTKDDRIDFETRNQPLISEFIQKSESQREPFLRRITKESSDESRIMFVVLAIVGVMRSKAIIEIRDKYRMVLAPGLGNRVTTAALYDFSTEIRSTFNYDWPSAPFDAKSIDFGDDGDDD